MDHFEPPKEPPGRGGLLSWPSKVWNLLLDYSEGEGLGAKIGLAVWGIVLLAIICFGVWGYFAMR